MSTQPAAADLVHSLAFDRDRKKSGLHEVLKDLTLWLTFEMLHNGELRC